jgi:hypothetical protein
MIQTSAAIVIHRPIGEVFRFAADLSTLLCGLGERRSDHSPLAHLETGRGLKRP